MPVKALVKRYFIFPVEIPSFLNIIKNMNGTDPMYQQSASRLTTCLLHCAKLMVSALFAPHHFLMF